eukprot:GHVR01188907.1.p1 GENE.GHVR01188907.1~~GHVR01188907.1.p1  ORF type:complete len:127 (+),score=13.72 GHVR01188907.1:226-606(+)
MDNDMNSTENNNMSNIDNMNNADAVGTKAIASYNTKYQSKSLATRSHFSNALNDITVQNRKIVCGCADLTTSVLSRKENDTFIHFGIREHVMFGVMKAIRTSNDSKIISICGTFLNFVTYGFPSCN